MLDFIKPKIIPIIIGILFLNVMFLNYHVLFRATTPIVQNITVGKNASPNDKSTIPPLNTVENQTVQTEPAQLTTPANTCAPSCLDAIRAATASLQLTQTVVNNTTQQTQSAAQEFFIPMGSGSMASQGTYATVPGVAAYVNTSLYTNISTVTFEVSASIPNGNQTIYLQLYNATDGYVIPNSQVTMSGGTPQLLISSSLNLPSGNKLYQVQINTQLNQAAIIDQARLHITTN